MPLALFHARPPAAARLAIHQCRNHTNIKATLHDSDRHPLDAYVSHPSNGSAGGSPLFSSSEVQSSGSEMEVEAHELHGRLRHLTEVVADVTAALSSLTSDPQVAAEVAAAAAARGGAAGMAPPPLTGGVTQSSACVVQHPGALCCTTAAVSEHPAPRTCSITLQTTARVVDDESAQHAISAESLTALAAQALAAAASDLLHSRTAALQAQPADRLQQHAELCSLLGRGDVVAAEHNPVSSEFGHESFVVQLRDRRSGRTCRAIFKPKVEGDAGGWHRAPMEWVAYRLNLLLGLDLVPPVVYLRGAPIVLHVDGCGRLEYREGAMMYWVEDAGLLCNTPERKWGCDKRRLLSDTRILDVLLHNSDRHHGHFLTGRHWAVGRWEGERWQGEMRPALIDHAASFRAEAEVTMVHDNAFQTGAVRCASAATFLRLRFLDRATLAEEFGGVLSAGEVAAMASRRDAVLRYLDGLVAAQGYGATVVE